MVAPASWLGWISGRGECAGEPGDEDERILDDLAPGNSDHAMTRRHERHVPATVALKRAPMAVERKPVHLHHQSLACPQKVHLVAGRTNVGQWLGQSGCANQLQQLALAIRSREAWSALPSQLGAQSTGTSAVRRPVDRRDQLALSYQPSRIGLGQRPLEILRVARDEKSINVRAGEVRVIPPRTRRSAGSRRPTRWTRKPARVLQLRPTTVTSTGPSAAGASRQRPAAERWLTSAPAPQASSAASSGAPGGAITCPTK